MLIANFAFCIEMNLRSSASQKDPLTGLVQG